MPINSPLPSRVNIVDVVSRLEGVKDIQTLDAFNAQKATLAQAVQDLKTHLTDQETQINTLTASLSDTQTTITGLQSQNDGLKQQNAAQQATIDGLNKKLAAATAPPAPADPAALAASFKNVIDHIQTQARVQSVSGPATTLRSMDIEVKGLVNVQDGNTVMVLPTLGSPVDPNQLSTLRLSFAAIPGAGRPSAPSLTGISPNFGPAAGGTTVTITGSSFTGTGAVQFGTAPAATFSVVSDTQITAVSPPGTGTVDVTVATPAGTSATSPADQFTYIPAPSVTGVSPNRGPAAGGTQVTVTGTGFTGATQVTFGTAAASSPKVLSNTQITVVSPSGSGTVDVTVTTPAGTSATSPADIVSSGSGVLRGTWFFDFDLGREVGPGAVSDVWWEQQTAILRQMVPQGSAKIVNLGVVDFDSLSAAQLQNLTYGTTPITGNNDASNQLVNGDVFAVLTHGGNYAKVQVLNYGYDLTIRWVTSATSGADQFTYTPAPSVTGVSPNRGPAAGGTQVTVTGTGFTGATQVAFGTAAARIPKVVSDTQITAVSPAGTGTVHVVVTTAGGTSPATDKDLFTYVPVGPPSNPTTPAGGEGTPPGSLRDKVRRFFDRGS